MFPLIPFFALLLVAFAGYAAKSGAAGDQIADRSSRLSALGGFASGILTVWIPACLLRFLAVLLLVASANVTSSFLASVTLFFPEAVLLVLFVLMECRHLRGSYSGQQEWKLSRSDGKRLAKEFLIVVIPTFFVAWWMITPADYGMYRGSFVSSVVAQSATDFVEAPKLQTATDANQIAKVESLKAIPDAIAWSALCVVLLIIGRIIYGYLYRVMNDDYLHFKPNASQSGGARSYLFPIRGGGPN